MKDSYNRSWTKNKNPLDIYCENNKITVDIEYGTKQEIVHVWTKVYFSKTREIIIDRVDRYPMSDDEILLELKKIIRERKINQIL